MMKKIVKQLLLMMFMLVLFCVPAVTANATQIEETTEEVETETEEREATPLTFEIAIFTYEMLKDATQEDMPTGFTLGDWEYNGVAVKAGFTENSDMICVMGEDWETGYSYRFIYDPNHEMFVPYFGADIKDGYIYTIPMYEDAEIPYGFIDAYFVIQTVPMFTYMREDAELTQEEIAVGSLSEDNYLVFLMMDENGKEVHYTYDLIDRTFQRSLLQKKDAEKVTELNEVIDELHSDIGELNAINAERMNRRLTIIGILVAVVLIMAGIIVNLLLKISRLKNEEEFEEDSDEEDSDEEGFKLEEEPETSDEKEVTKEEVTSEEIPSEEVNDEAENYLEKEILNIDFVTEDDYVEDEEDLHEKPSKKSIRSFFAKKSRFYDDEEVEEQEEEVVEKVKSSLETMHLDFPDASDEEIEILDLDLDDL